MSRKKSRAAKSQHDGSERALSSDQPLALPFHAPFNSYSFFFVLAAGVLVRGVVVGFLGFFYKPYNISRLVYFSLPMGSPPFSSFNLLVYSPLHFFFLAFF